MTAGSVVLAGFSTRAAAASAARAGYSVTALDAFGDADQHPSVRAVSLPRDLHHRFTAAAAARAAATIDADAAVYLAPFENHPLAVQQLAQRRALWGNAPAVLREVRDPLLVSKRFGGRGVGTTTTRTIPPRRGLWLMKPLDSGGGQRVRLWTQRSHAAAGYYWQEYVAGIPASVVFVAAAGLATPLGASVQLIGDSAFGATGYRYCGNILLAGRAAGTASDTTIDRLSEVARQAAARFDLRGVNGVDVIIRAGIPHVVEVNPRWTGCMELVERAYRISVFAMHAAACTGAPVLHVGLAKAWRSVNAVGKAIVFARHDVITGDTEAWQAAGFGDVPHPGERILAGHPVCTIYAEGDDVESCRANLVRCAGDVHDVLDKWRRRVA